MNTNNYVEYGHGHFTAQMAYVDLEEYLADQIFTDRELPVHFYKKQARHPDSNYVIVFCKIRTEDREAFAAAMEELTVKMLLLGHTDYTDFCEERFAPIQEAVKEETSGSKKLVAKRDEILANMKEYEAQLAEENANLQNSMFGTSRRETKLKKLLHKEEKKLQKVNKALGEAELEEDLERE